MKTTNFTLLGLFLLAVLAAVPAALAQQSFTEDFTSTTYMDAVNTTADWNTTDGELKLFPYVPSLVGNYDTTGQARAVVVSGDYAYIASGSYAFRIIDISDPANPTSVGYCSPLGWTYDVAVSGDYAFVANAEHGLQVIDISDPTNPTIIGAINRDGGAGRGVAVSGDYVFLADGDPGLIVIDISDPTTPTIIDTDIFTSNAVDVAVAGDYAYVVDNTFGLRVVDISDPTNMDVVGQRGAYGNPRSVAISGNYAYLVTYDSGIWAFNISDPTNPWTNGLGYSLSSSRDVAIAGNYAFVAGDDSGLHMIDISIPWSLGYVGSFDTPGEAYGVNVSGNNVFVADYHSGLQIINYSDFLDPAFLGNCDTPGFANEIAVSGNHAYVADGLNGLQVIDIIDSTNPTPLGSYDTPGYAMDVKVVGYNAYVAAYGGGLQIIDVMDPDNPATIGSLTTPGLANGVSVSGNNAFVADGASGLQVVDITDTAIPAIIGSCDTPGSGLGVTDLGNLAIVADGTYGIQLIDITDPTNPTILGSCDTPGEAVTVTVHGDCAFVADYGSGLQMIDISDPTNPVIIGTCDTPGNARSVAISGDYAFVADYGPGIQVVDISDLTSPTIIGTYNTPGTAYGVTFAGDCIYVADYGSGLQILAGFQGHFDLDTNYGQSLNLAGAVDNIVSIRLFTTQVNDVSWDLSANSGSNWQGIVPDGNWNQLTVPGSDLRWRSTHNWTAPGASPMVSNLTLEWLNDFAPIASITDVPGDQGGLVDVTFCRSGYDTQDEFALPTTGYNIYQRVDLGSLPAKRLDPSSAEQILLTPSGGQAWPLPGEEIITSGDGIYVVGSSSAPETTSFPPGTWKLVSTAFATQQDSYMIEATTDADSTNTGIAWSVYLVTTHTNTPSIWFTSLPDSGYSVDNIAPGVPVDVKADYLSGGVALDWKDATEVDFQCYRVYRDSDPGFIPSAENLVQEITSSAWTDPTADPWDCYYKITVLDHAGNEGEAGSPNTVSNVHSTALPTRTALLGAVPNPFNPTTQLCFETADAGHVRLGIYDLAGRLVTNLVDQYRVAGTHHVSWDGRDKSGQMSSAGIYLYRFELGAFSETKRVVLVK